MSLLLSILSNEYIPQNEFAAEIKKMLKKIQRVIIHDDVFYDDSLNFEIFKEDKSLPKIYGKFQTALIRFSIETENGFHNSPDAVDTMISGKLYKGLADISLEGALFLLNDFFNIFMKKYTEMAILGEAEDDNGNEAIYTITHFKAAQKLEDSDWLWRNPDELLRRANKIE